MRKIKLIKNIIISVYIVLLVWCIDTKNTPSSQAKATEFIPQSQGTGQVGVEIKREDSSVASVWEAKEEPKATNTQTEEIEEYIKQVFGKDANKALLLLRGKGEGTCAENRFLDPDAVNDNTKWGGIGKDWGIFQINDKFHPVFKLNLHKEWKANVDYAYRMFLNDGRSFKRWTCGRIYGI